MRILVNGMFGLGDNLYQLAYVNQLIDQGHFVAVKTPWPNMYPVVDNLEFLKPTTTLRTQNKNINNVDKSVWCNEYGFDKTIDCRYSAGDNIPGTMSNKFGVKPKWGLKQFPGFHGFSKKYIIVRPVTERSEWLNKSRNPLPAYIDFICQHLSKDYLIVSIADVDGDNEWYAGFKPYNDIEFNKGELTADGIFNLCMNASAIVGGVGWIVPYALHTETPTLIVCGGNGGNNHPGKLVNGDCNASNITFLLPDDYCMCSKNNHNCKKEISNLKGKVDDWKSSF